MVHSLSFVNYLYDPQRQGYDVGQFTTLTGTPAIASGKLSLTTASFIGKQDLDRGEITFGLTVPTLPTTGDVRAWGVALPAASTYLTFDVTDDVFRAVAKTADRVKAPLINANVAIAFNATPRTIVRSDGGSFVTDGFVVGQKVTVTGATNATNNDTFTIITVAALTLTLKIGTVLVDEAAAAAVTMVGDNSVIIAWQAGWTNAMTEFTLKWSPVGAEFYVNNVRWAFLNDAFMPKFPLALYANNAHTDAMLLSYLKIEDTERDGISALLGGTLLAGLKYDYVGVTWVVGTFTETFVFKNGGASGVTQATVTVVYVAADKAQLVSVTRS